MSAVVADKSLQPTRESGCSSTARLTSLGPAWLSFFRWTHLMRFLMLAFYLASAGCSTPRPQAPRVQRTEAVLLAPGDAIDIRYNRLSVCGPPPVFIDTNGVAPLPFGVSVKLGGLTTSQAASVIQAAYVPHYFTRLDVEVTKVQPLIYVEGEFKNPGVYPWTNGMSLQDAFAAADGFTVFALKWIILRHPDGSKEQYKWSTKRPLTDNPALRPGDSVSNPRH